MKRRLAAAIAAVATALASPAPAAPLGSFARTAYTTPLAGEYLRLGMELQYLGSRLGYDGQEVPDTTVANLTLTSKNWWPNWQLSLSLRNAFNSSNADVQNPGNGAPTFPRDGRNLWLQISRDFK